MKKLIVTMLLALSLCVFLAFAVSAEEYNTVDNLGEPSWYTGNYQLITDKSSKVVLSNGDGTYTAYPAYYVLKYNIKATDGVITEAYVSGFDYSFVNEKTGKNYTTGAVYKVEIPNGMTKVTSSVFGHNTQEKNINEVIMSDSILTIESHAFRDTTNLKRVVVSKNITFVGAYAFYRAKGLEEIIFPEGSNAEVDTSGANIFVECIALKELDLSKKNIKVLGSSFLTDCTNLEKVTLPDSLEQIGYCSIYKNPKMYFASDFLPSNLKTVGFHFLSGCKSVNKVLYFPDGFEGFTSNYNFSNDKEIAPDLTLVFLGKVSGSWNFEQFNINKGERKVTFIFTKNQFSDLSGKIVQANNDGTLTYMGKTASTDDTDYWVQEGTLSISFGNAAESHSKYKTDENGNTWYHVAANSYKLFFCGGENVELVYGIRGNVANSEWTKPYTTPFTFDRQGHMDEGTHYDLTEVLSLANCGIDGVTEHTCVLCQRVEKDVIPATGNHTVYSVSPCADKCEICELYVQKANPSHSIFEYFDYANGFTASGLYGTRCSNLGCNHLTEEAMDAMIIDLGFSVPEGGKYVGINYAYRINKAVIEEYERVNECKVSFGTFVAAGKNINDEAKVIKHTYAVVFDIVDLVINYGTTSEHNGKDVVFAGYVSLKKNEEVTESFFQSVTSLETTEYVSDTYGTFYGISYNKIKG